MKYEKVHSIYNRLLAIEDIDPTLVSNFTNLFSTFAVCFYKKKFFNLHKVKFTVFVELLVLWILTNNIVMGQPSQLKYKTLKSPHRNSLTWPPYSQPFPVSQSLTITEVLFALFFF